MADIAQKWSVAREASQGPNLLARLFDWKPFLVFLCLCRRSACSSVFLTYPLGLGIWLAFTDTTIGRRGVFDRAREFQSLSGTIPMFWNAVFNTIFYTAVATFGKFALGLWLALLLNHHFPFKSLYPRHRAAALDRADRAVGAGLLVDLRSAILHHLLHPGRRAALRSQRISIFSARPGRRASR